MGWKRRKLTAEFKAEAVRLCKVGDRPIKQTTPSPRAFFATLKAEHVEHEDFATRDVGTASIGDYIESFYNCARRHRYVGYVSPIEFELRSLTDAMIAA
jgi:transposase InsO family protein